MIFGKKTNKYNGINIMGMEFLLKENMERTERLDLGGESVYSKKSTKFVVLRNLAYS
ncbi:hypothetical protein F383_19641 [Gossypium arboreum]|uniref:Uncharacterized protein n=1 Tax=Gossypium arboreum TaxID=29729 RepID=A0A0B0NNM4_GOSAR|nr:hypothetical protein F383_19641 [Gossypium arboreum]